MPEFQRPDFLFQGKTKRESLLSPIGDAVSTIPAMYDHYKLQKKQREIENARLDLQKRQLEAEMRAMEARYGTGEPTQPALPGVPEMLQRPETEEEKIRRIGIDRYRALNQPQYVGFGPEGERIALSPGEKPFNVPQQKPAKLTVGQETADREFAKDFTKFISTGGYADVDKSLSQLDETIRVLESGETNATGPLIGLLPTKVRNLSKSGRKGVSTQNYVEEIVQRNLKKVLGGQFTEKEGEKLVQRAYDPQQEEPENAKRVRRLLNQIREAALAKQRAGEYFEKHGTLVGFDGTIYSSVGEIEAAAGLQNGDGGGGGIMNKDPLGIR